MMADKTQNLGVKLLAQGQLNKDITLNNALTLIDSLINTGLESLNTFSKPPTNMQEGLLILTSQTPEEGFEKYPFHIAFYKNGWHFLKPKEGLILWVKDIKKCVVFDGINFIELSGNDISISPLQPSKLEEKLEEIEKKLEELLKPSSLGINATPDENNKFVVRSNYSLFNTEKEDVRVILNKSSSSNTASFIFQSNWNGIAEFGTLNGENFILKVASNGIWKEVFEVNSKTGEINFKQDILKNGNKVL
jgi:hypothetical protein